MKQLKDVPFALVGVNSDNDIEALKGIIKEKKLNWRSFQDKAGADGKISESWGVNAWPTVFIIDAKGTIRWKGEGSHKGSNDPLIQELLAEMGHSVEIHQ